LRALLPERFKHVPIVCYFHENQLTYPLAPDDWRDFQYAFTNITTALAADAVWFNSQAHLNAFVAAVGELLAKMPEHVPADLPARIAQRAEVRYPAVEPPAGRSERVSVSRGSAPDDRPLRILWCHRWEFDKNPEAFFTALSRVRDSGARFELVLLGEQFRTAPPVFAQILDTFADQIVHAGYVPDHAEYLDWVASCDVVVSTAIQENFGIAVVEAILAGCLPLLPNRLSYPELIPGEFGITCLYDNDDALAERLARIASGHVDVSTAKSGDLRRAVRERFGADQQARRLDEALDCTVCE
jgi:glycosyltransferase involved in cell wall biosynthesis